MAKYKYLITDKYGKEKKGTMEAVSEEAAMRKLKGEGSIVLELSEAFDLDNASWNITIGNPVKKKDITIFCKQFYSILTAGVTVIDGLRMVQDQTENKYLREALYRVMVNVEKGDSLADAMEMENKIFPSLLIHMVAAGEATGNLEIAFDRICTQFDKDMKLNSMIKSAMIYPIVVLVVAVGVIIVLMTTVIPNFQQTFESMGEDLPMLTKMVIGLSDFMTSNFIAIAIGLILLLTFIICGKKTEPGKQFTSRVALKIPMFRNFSVKNAAAKFSMTMSTLIMSGVPLVEALEIVGNVIAVTDLKTMKFPAVCEILMIVVGGVHLFFHASQWLYYIAGALFMGVFLLVCALLFKKVTGKAGLGLGDIEFMACIGLCIGFGHSLLALIAGCLLGAVIQGGIQLYHKKSGRFPTTPYLAMGVYLVLLWGDTVLNWYVRTFVY